MSESKLKWIVSRRKRNVGNVKPRSVNGNKKLNGNDVKRKKLLRNDGKTISRGKGMRKKQRNERLERRRNGRNERGRKGQQPGELQHRQGDKVHLSLLFERHLNLQFRRHLLPTVLMSLH